MSESSSKKDYRIKITGMSCASCVNNVEKAISKIEGSSNVSVNLATEEAYLKYDGETIQPVLDAVENTGFGASLENEEQAEGESRFKVEGMTCASCVANVERAITKVPGVEKADVNLGTEEATVGLGSAKIDQIIQAIKDSGYDAEYIDGDEEQTLFEKTPSRFKTKFLTALPLAFVVMVMDMGPMLIGGQWNSWVMDHLFAWNVTQLILTAIVMFIAGGPFFTGAWKAAKNLYADMNTLVAVGTGAAFVFSSYATFFGTHGGVVTPMDIYFDTAAIIIALILLGKWMEERARYKSRDAMSSLMELTPQKAHRIDEQGNSETIALKQVEIGDYLLVKAFEQVPVDGLLLDDYASIDESMMTGESVPAEKEKNQEVIGGTRNTDSSFKMKATRVGKETALSRMIDTVRKAQGSKPPIQRLVDKIAYVFVPIVIVIALITLITWLIIGDDPTKAIVNMVAVLIIACPCALGLATPTGIMVGSGRAAEKGILIKDAVTLEEAKSIDVILLDKTGTLTTGEMSVAEIYTTADTNEKEMLEAVSAVESQSDHPLANAIVSYTKSQNITFSEAEDVQTQMGSGISGVYRDKKIKIGSVKLRSDYSDEENKFIENEQEKGRTVLTVQSNNSPTGLISVSDTPKDEAKKFVEELKAMNIIPVMVTGDQEKSARYIAEVVGISEIQFEVKPDEKAKLVEKYQKEGKHVAMVGDGINDAAALVQADLGIALSSGTDLAVSSSDITIIGGNLSQVTEAIKLSRSVLRVIKQNLFWAFVYNTVGIPLAAIGVLSPMFAAAAMALSSVSVVGNSLRIKKF